MQTSLSFFTVRAGNIVWTAVSRRLVPHGESFPMLIGWGMPQNGHRITASFPFWSNLGGSSRTRTSGRLLTCFFTKLRVCPLDIYIVHFRFPDRTVYLRKKRAEIIIVITMMMPSNKLGGLVGSG